MARPFTGQAHLQAAREQCHRAKSVKQMRQALAVLLPLEPYYWIGILIPKFLELPHIKWLH